MPAIAEVDGLVRRLAQLVHIGRTLDRLQIGVDQGVAEAADEAVHLLRRELLAGEEDGDVFEESVVDGAGGGVVQLLRKIHAADFRAAGA